MEMERNPVTKLDLILAAWETLDCESVGAKELKEIRAVVAERFGDSAVDSPATVARLLVDEGALLRHPEVLECDAKWRERRLARRATQTLNFESLAAAVQSIAECERLRRELAQHHDKNGLRELRDAVALSRRELKAVSASKVVSESDRAQANEIAGWLEVWLRAPELFTDWLDLRRAAPEFRERFGD
ncbi:MAG: hypothetical protein M3R68_06455 [Acidobacteriota bacterium]|nr:hypothetical protein [Acidobacteriota bacterium]